MKLKTLLATLALTAAPSLALAMGCHTADRQAMSCAEGMVWNADTAACEPIATG